MLSIFVCYKKNDQVVSYNYPDARLALRCDECPFNEECEGPDAQEDVWG